MRDLGATPPADGGPEPKRVVEDVAGWERKVLGEDQISLREKREGGVLWMVACHDGTRHSYTAAHLCMDRALSQLVPTFCTLLPPCVYNSSQPPEKVLSGGRHTRLRAGRGKWTSFTGCSAELNPTTSIKRIKPYLRHRGSLPYMLSWNS